MSQLLLSPEHRLHQRSEFLNFFASATKVFQSKFLTIYRIKNDFGHFRLGITMKVRTLSVNRNRIRRKIREGFRTRAPDLGSFDYNVVFHARGLSASRWTVDLDKDLREFFGDKTPC